MIKNTTVFETMDQNLRVRSRAISICKQVSEAFHQTINGHSKTNYRHQQY